MTQRKPYDPKLLQLIDELRRERSEQAQLVGPEFYDSFLRIPSDRLKRLVRQILRSTYPLIHRNVLAGRWGEDDIYDFVMLVLELVFEGKVAFRKEDGAMSFFAPVGDPPTDQGWEALQGIVSGARPVIRSEFVKCLSGTSGEP